MQARDRKVATFAGLAVALLGGAAALLLMAEPGASDIGKPSVSKRNVRDAGLASAYLSGRHAEANADTGRAVNYLTRALELDPQNAALLQTSYFLAVQAGDFSAAVPAAKKAYEAAPRRGLAGIVLAADGVRRGQYREAWGYIEQVPTQNVAGFALPLLRAWIAAPTQPAEKAIAELDALKSVQDATDKIDVMAGLLYEYYGRSTDALARYDALTARAEHAQVADVFTAVEGYDRLGKTPQAKALLAKFMAAHNGLISPSVDAYLALLGHNAFGKVTPATGLASALYASADMLLSKDPNQFGVQIGIAFTQTALYLNPDSSIARRFVGTTLAARGRTDEANAMLMTIKRGTPGYLEAQAQISENLARAGKVPEAMAVLKAVIKERPDWVDAHLTLGDLLRREKKFNEAVEEYSSAIKLTAPDKPNTWALYYTRGVALERAKNWDAAERDFRKALELKPDEPSVLNYLGYSYLDRGVNVKEGRKMIEDAVSKRPDDGYIIDSWGWALYLTGEFDNAVTQLEKAVESAPSDATINEHLGDAYWKVGRRAEARFQWQRALTFEPEDSQRTSIMSKIEKGLAQK